jgi:hypothetical protein
MSRFQRSWELLKCSVWVIGTNKKLLLFPVVITVLMAVISMFFILPIVLWHTGHGYSDAAHWTTVAHRWVAWSGDSKDITIKPEGYILMVALYLVSTFLATFFNVAFYSQILNALRGQPVSVSGGLKIALSRSGSIATWSLMTGLVGIIIQAIEERVGIIGRWIVGLLGMAWSVASVFVVPVIIVESSTVNPLHFLKTSADILRKTWGESLLGYLGVRFGEMLILFASLAFLGAAAFLSFRLDNFWIIGIAAIIWVISLMVFMYLLNVASNVYRGALFIYASEGTAPAPFNQDQMNMAWKVKPGSTLAGE